MPGTVKNNEYFAGSVASRRLRRVGPRTLSRCSRGVRYAKLSWRPKSRGRSGSALNISTPALEHDPMRTGRTMAAASATRGSAPRDRCLPSRARVKHAERWVASKSGACRDEGSENSEDAGRISLLGPNPAAICYY